MGDPAAFEETTRLLAEAFKARGVAKVAGIEARGFVFGAALAARLQVGFVPIRKLGKLPLDTYKRSYTLEYGEDTLEMHKDAAAPGERVLVVDDLLATGGTLAACIELVRAAGATVAGCSLLIDLPDLNGREKLSNVRCEALLTY